MPWLCRDCFETGPSEDGVTDLCPDCGSARVISHKELNTLSIAHIDCDAFYATVEMRDDPSLKGKPVLVGGKGGRGVIMAASYEARKFGCRSAMPMFKARKLCPQAIIVRPNMAKYSVVGREVRKLMHDTTPLVEPISIDEAFLDLSGTEKLHGGAPAHTLARLADRVENEVGITVTVGLSHNKFLAKIASDLDKPRGFSVVGRSETLGFLDTLPVSKLWGVGKALQRKLHADGFHEIGSLRACSEEFLVERYGSIGSRLSRFSYGNDNRRVDPKGNRKSISSESTFFNDIRSADELIKRLWPLSEKVAARAKAAELSGRVITVKFKTDRFLIRTRRRTLTDPTQLAEVIWRTGADLVKKEARGTAYRLIGIGISDFSPADHADPPDLGNPDGERIKVVEQTIDNVRARFGTDAIKKGRGLKPEKNDRTSRPPAR
ncbi:MAG: DNA polymerase IV [Rhodospirillaceae bacterium]|nr:DNA polymerase IV [Rhodospirillaceae bacterium]|tara:strand:- start:5909 stop:7213 length:1305 start_codon:yes stop_codon:yes gene_type:complete